MIECGLFKEAPGFSCTGSDESHVWGELHDKNGNIGPLLDKFHCGECQQHAHKLFLGLHSLVSLGIGKKLTSEKYKDSFFDLKTDIENVYAQAIQDKRL